MTWEEAINEVIRRADRPLHYSEIAEQIAARQLRRKIGPNPAQTVAAIVSKLSLDPKSEIQRVARGEYAARPYGSGTDITPQHLSQPTDTDTETGALRAFGMYWQREFVDWSKKPSLLGRQQLGAVSVNFSDQVGVYLLHDRDRVIYVGRAGDGLHTRLKAHTLDRLSGRWDRFSWFGLRGVDSDGNLTSPSSAWTHEVVIETLEALLIESLEPPLNRKRGDNFSAIEYLQVKDKSIENQHMNQKLIELLQNNVR